MSEPPSELLVRAADLIRDRAAAATPGPWEATHDDHGRGRVDDMVWADSIGRYVTEDFTSPPEQRQANAVWVATLSPSVAEYLERWLVEVWKHVRVKGYRDDCWTCKPAVGFARSILASAVSPEETQP